MPEVWLITGIPGAGKTTVAGLLARRFQRGVHIEADGLQNWIVSGGVRPGDEPLAEGWRQLDLVNRNAGLLARSYAEAGFDVVVDHVVVTRRTLTDYRRDLDGLPLHLVVLTPGKAVAAARDVSREKSRAQVVRIGVSVADRWAHLEDEMAAELMGVGLWIDSAELTPEETVDAILRNRGRARIEP